MNVTKFLMHERYYTAIWRESFGKEDYREDDDILISIIHGYAILPDINRFYPYQYFAILLEPLPEQLPDRNTPLVYMYKAMGLFPVINDKLKCTGCIDSSGNIVSEVAIQE